MDFLVTGGAGFIGSAYVRGLISGSYATQVNSITILDSLTYAGNLKNLDSVSNSKKLKFIKGDIRDLDLVRSLIASIDVVVNFAAESHVDRSITDSRNFIDTNIVGTANLVNCAIESNVKKYVQISTDEVYGSINQGSWSENSVLEPNSPYASSKAAADLIVRGLGNTHGLNYNITRCSNNYGPYQFPEKLIPLFITNIIEGKDVPVYGEGKNIREWLHVDDHCKAINLVVEYGKPQQIYNVGGGYELTNIELTLKILSEMGSPATSIRYVEDRKNHDLRYSIDDSKIRTELGFKPEIKFEDGLRATMNWYLENEQWWRPLKMKESV